MEIVEVRPSLHLIKPVFGPVECSSKTVEPFAPNHREIRWHGVIFPDSQDVDTGP